MRWVKFAVLINLLCLQLWSAEKSMKLVLADGSVLGIPNVLFYRLSRVETSKTDQLQGFSQDGRSSFIFSRLHSKFIGGRAEQLFTQTEIYVTLQKQGMRRPTFSTVKDNMSSEAQKRNIFRIHDPGGAFHGNLMDFEMYEYATGTVVFLLLGPEDDFYRLTPHFNEMVQGYTIEGMAGLEDIVPSMLGGSVLLIMLNLAFVWYGFYRISHLHNESLEEDY